MDPKILLTAKKSVGTKETLRSVEKHQCKAVFIAKDANAKVLKSLVDACECHGVDIYEVQSMQYLGECCGIKVAAASAGLL